jgi:ornithine cyclodeaminase
MVEATRLTEPQVLLKTEWVDPGAFVVPYGTISAVELSLTDIMDKIVVDDWNQCKGGVLGSLRRHVETGKLSEDTFYAELGEIVAGKKTGREHEGERILFWHRGLSINDIALGYLIYEKARGRGLGTNLAYR